MYKVSEVAQQCGVSTTAIYKGLKLVDEQFQTKFEGKTLITEEGLLYFIEKYKQQKPASDEVLLSLIRQLEEKDRQLSEKDTQINQLIEQSLNFQILLKSEQDKTLQLQPPKQSFFQRLFRKD